MIVLASSSKTRQTLLHQTGLKFTAYPADIDEGNLKKAYAKAGKSIAETALALAIAKAVKISQLFPEATIIGADQICVCAGQPFDKAESMAEARQQLQFFRGKTHELVTAAVLVRRGQVIWQKIVTPLLTMRHCSDEFLEEYINTLNQALLGSVGCYQVEGLGAQLFSEIQGDIFTIMGLPLLELFSALRQHGLLKE